MGAVSFGYNGFFLSGLFFLSIKVNGCLMDPLPPPVVLRKSSTSSPSNMMETSIDEGIETEEPDTEEDPATLFSAYQTARFRQRRHTLSEVTNQPGPSNPGLIIKYTSKAKNKWFLSITFLKITNINPPQVNYSLWVTILPWVAWTQTLAMIWAPCTATLACWRIHPLSVK